MATGHLTESKVGLSKVAVVWSRANYDTTGYFVILNLILMYLRLGFASKSQLIRQLRLCRLL
ncbi:MAG: hypothetical protein C5B44_05410 [Acidobacteria bacterium]|nr:MAG: hypothetical protein C5B44_05410 [Acidobacteriota bacterium]